MDLMQAPLHPPASPDNSSAHCRVSPRESSPWWARKEEEMETRGGSGTRTLDSQSRSNIGRSAVAAHASLYDIRLLVVSSLDEAFIMS